MDRVAIFVDAGYLFAQGSAALSGSKKARSELVLDPNEALNAFKEIAKSKAEHCRLLRIYWYDGTISGGRPTAEQALLAQLDDVKMRLGFINNFGQQKGVDSLIVTDLIELARQRSICDAVLISGDEDVRVGVQIAQNYGVRVHLVGVKPSRGTQSLQLLQEADTTVEWGPDTIRHFLTIRSEALIDNSGIGQPSPRFGDAEDCFDSLISQLVHSLAKADIDGIRVYWESERGVPEVYDRRLLPTCRSAIGRDLDQTEKRFVRSRFQHYVRLRLQSQ